jgi:hypothetical protein
MKPNVQVYFEPRDVWVGVYWTRNAFSELVVYVCLVPMLPIRLIFPARRL